MFAPSILFNFLFFWTFFSQKLRVVAGMETSRSFSIFGMLLKSGTGPWFSTVKPEDTIFLVFTVTYCFTSLFYCFLSLYEPDSHIKRFLTVLRKHFFSPFCLLCRIKSIRNILRIVIELIGISTVYCF
jgi:hypothetical protein